MAPDIERRSRVRGAIMHKSRLYNIIYHSDLVGTRVALGISEIIWAISLLMPGETFSRSKTYRGMNHVAVEETWGIIWLLSGFVQLCIVYSEDYHSRGAVWFAGFNAMLWSTVVVSLYTCVWPMNAVASGDLALALSAMWVYIRSGWTAKSGGGEQ